MLDASVARLRGASAGDSDRATLAECLFARGQVHFVRSANAAAAADLQEALRMLGRPRTDQRTLAIRIRSTLALALHRTGRTVQSIAEYERIVAELEAMGRGSTQLVAALHNNLGVLLFRSGQMLRAKQASERAFEIGRSLGEPDPVPEAVYARMLADLGRPREGLPLVLHALEGARASGSERVLLIALQNSAATLCAAGELVRCEAVLGEAQASMKRSTPAGSAAYGALDVQRAELALKRGDPREARRALLHALEVVGTPAEPGETQIRALALLARIEASLGELAQANKHAAQAVALARNAMVGFDHSRWLGIAQVAQGLVQKANGDPRAAEASWRAALDELQATDGDASAVTEEARRLVEGKSPP